MPATDARQFPDRPLVGVGAVVVHQDRVLLVLRGRQPLKGYWSLPGGLVEIGETLRGAAEREVREETGLSVTASEVAEVFERIERDTAGRVIYHYVLVDFVARVTGPEQVRAASDADDARWVEWNTLNSLQLTPGLAEILAKVCERIRTAKSAPLHPQGGA
jgi:ADP-ribose pyrophosphatase YjhB (NUDIX family)